MAFPENPYLFKQFKRFKQFNPRDATTFQPRICTDGHGLKKIPWLPLMHQ